MKKILLFIALMCAMHVSAQVVTTKSEQPSATNVCPYLDTEGGKCYLDGNQITRKEYENFLKNNSPEAWQSYRKGTALWATGWSLLGVGTAASYAGALLFITDGAQSMFESGHGPGMLAGIGLLAGGGALTIAGIPCVIVGGKKKFSAHEIYNQNCVKQQPQVELSLQTSQNGIGFALTF